jgi:hypothetical protein
MKSTLMCAIKWEMAHGVRGRALVDSGVLCGIARAVAAVMLHEPAGVSVRDNPSRTCGAQAYRGREQLALQRRTVEAHSPGFRKFSEQMRAGPP